MNPMKILGASVMMSVFLMGCLGIEFESPPGEPPYECSLEQPIAVDELPPGVNAGGDVPVVDAASTSINASCAVPYKYHEEVQYYKNGGFSEERNQSDVDILDGTLLETVNLFISRGPKNQIGAATTPEDPTVFINGQIKSRIKGVGNQECTYTIRNLADTGILKSTLGGLSIDHSGAICEIALYFPDVADYWPFAFTEVTLIDRDNKSETGRYGCWNSPRVIDQGGFADEMNRIVEDIKISADSLGSVEKSCVTQN